MSEGQLFKKEAEAFVKASNRESCKRILDDKLAIIQDFAEEHPGRDQELYEYLLEFTAMLDMALKLDGITLEEYDFLKVQCKRETGY